jgi:aspartate kinase
LLLRAASEALRRPHRKNTNSGFVTPVTNGIFRGMSYSETPSLPSSPRSSSSPRSASPGPLSSLTPLTVPQTGQTSPEFNTTVDIIRSEHLNAARASVTDPFLLEELEAEIEKDCDWLRGFLFAAQVSATVIASHVSYYDVVYQVIGEITPRSKDCIVGLGEKLSCKIMTAVLRDQVLIKEATRKWVLPLTLNTGHRCRIRITR